MEYVTGNVAPANEAQETLRKTEIAKYILNNFDRSTLNGEFDACLQFRASRIDSVITRFSNLSIRKINIGAVFTYGQNVSQDDNKTGDNDGFESNNVHADELQLIMDDYNKMFDTQFSIDTFRAYYDDINRRLRKKHPDLGLSTFVWLSACSLQASTPRSLTLSISTKTSNTTACYRRSAVPTAY